MAAQGPDVPVRVLVHHLCHIEPDVQPYCVAPRAQVPGLIFSPRVRSAGGTGNRTPYSTAAVVECSGRVRLCAALGSDSLSPPAPPHTRLVASLCLFVFALSLTLYLIIRRREAESLGLHSLMTAAIVRAGDLAHISAREGRNPPGRAPSLPVPGVSQWWVHSSLLPKPRRDLEGRNWGAAAGSGCPGAAGKDSGEVSVGLGEVVRGGPGSLDPSSPKTSQ